MKAPKILPWVAAKAGISDALALKLWRRAASEAGVLTGKSEGSEYWGLAVERFLDLVESESTRSAADESEVLLPTARLDWVWRHQSRMTFLALLLAQNVCRLWQQTWQRECAPRAFLKRTA